MNSLGVHFPPPLRLCAVARCLSIFVLIFDVYVTWRRLFDANHYQIYKLKITRNADCVNFVNYNSTSRTKFALTKIVSEQTEFRII